MKLQSKTSWIVCGAAMALAVNTASAALVSTWSASKNLTAQGAGYATVGDNTANAADDAELLGDFSALTLATVGDKITFTSTVEFKGAVSTNNQFRLGIFDGPNFKGYKVANRKLWTSGSTRVLSTGGASELGSNTTAAAIGNGVYDTSITLKLETGGVRVKTLITKGATKYGEFDYLDATQSQGVTYNQIAYLAGGNMNADQMLVTNADVTFTPVPEPSSFALLGLGGLALILRRKK